MKKLKEWWFLYVPLAGLAVWLITINTRIFDSSEQRHDVISAFEDSPSPAEQAVNRILDSIADDTHIKNDAHAIKTRQARYEDNKKTDSLRTVKDSLFLDMITRQTVQIEQMKKSIDSINLHH